jgi:hypothetical protein
MFICMGFKVFAYEFKQKAGQFLKRLPAHRELLLGKEKMWITAEVCQSRGTASMRSTASRAR